MGADMYGCCTTDQTFLEYTGVKFVSPMQIRGAFTRWTGRHLPELVLAKLRLPARSTCLPRRGAVGVRRIGRVGLGRTRAQLIARLGAPAKRTRWSLRWCVKGSKRRLTAVFSRHSPVGRSRLIVTAARGYRVRGVGPGGSARRLERRFRAAVRVGRRIRLAAPRSTRIFAVRGGKVRVVGVASRSVLAKRARLRRDLRRAGY
jgi:hypothetical protein